MIIRNLIGTCAISLGLSALLVAQTDTVPRGAEITVRTIDNIDARGAADGRIYRAAVDRDVLDRSGRVVVPRNADAELIVRQSSSNDIVLDLESISVQGRRYVVSSPAESVATDGSREGIGTNKRTGKYVGGGALLGTIIGAIAGGGKGAAIGALSGAGAGAVGQTVTRGRAVRVPSETLLTFRLDEPLRIGGPDAGYTRDGQHYHRYDSNRQGESDRQRNPDYDRR